MISISAIVCACFPSRLLNASTVPSACGLANIDPLQTSPPPEDLQVVKPHLTLRLPEWLLEFCFCMRRHFWPPSSPVVSPQCTAPLFDLAFPSHLRLGADSFFFLHQYAEICTVFSDTTQPLTLLYPLCNPHIDDLSVPSATSKVSWLLSCLVLSWQLGSMPWHACGPSPPVYHGWTPTKSPHSRSVYCASCPVWSISSSVGCLWSGQVSIHLVYSLLPTGEWAGWYFQSPVLAHLYYLPRKSHHCIAPCILGHICSSAHCSQMWVLCRLLVWWLFGS